LPFSILLQYKKLTDLHNSNKLKREKYLLTLRDKLQ
jgi:hypothetical protein